MSENQDSVAAFPPKATLPHPLPLVTIIGGGAEPTFSKRGKGRANAFARLLLLTAAGITAVCMGVWWLKRHEGSENLSVVEKQIIDRSIQELTAQPPILQENDSGEDCYQRGLRYWDGDGETKNLEEAVRWFKEAADKGSIGAQSKLGAMYRSGEVLEKSSEEAFKWYGKAAKQGDRDAQFIVGEMCADGEGATQDYKKAMEWFRRAVEVNADGGAKYCVNAAYRLAEGFRTGLGVAKDLAEAYKWYEVASAYGHIESMKKRGWMQAQGEGVEKDSEQAYISFRYAADHGDPSAQYNVGVMFQKGIGVRKNLPEAVTWHRKSANQGFTLAQTILASMYANGIGMAKDDKKAVEWYRQSADAGDRIAQFNLGTCYYHAKGVAKDLNEAFYWFQKAAEQNDIASQIQLGWMYKTGEGVAKDPAHFFRWHYRAAEQGNTLAQHEIAEAYRIGFGVKKDLKLSVHWHRQAAAQGFDRSKFCLGIMYYGGVGVDKDPQEAARWFQEASEGSDTSVRTMVASGYSVGLVMPKDPVKAIRLYRQSAEEGDPLAQNGLGLMYWKGEGVSKNLIFAYKWLLLAKARRSTEEIQKTILRLKAQLSQNQAEEAQRLAASFSPFVRNKKPDTHQEPSPMELEGNLSDPYAPSFTGKPKNQQPIKTQPIVLYGTGFFISADGAIITAAHVVQKAKKLNARLSDGQTVSLRMLAFDERLDLALLQLVSSGKYSGSILPLADSDNLTLGQGVMTIGFPNPEVQGIQPKYTQGTISALTGLADDEKTVQISVPIQPGNSGGALMDMSGRVVGVVVSRLNAITMAKRTGALSENVNYAVKSSQLASFLKRIPASANLQGLPVVSLPISPASETIRIAQKATILIVAECE